MARRLTALLVIWVGLVGVAMPLLACSMVDSSCCPWQARSGCSLGDRELDSSATIALCCAAIPTRSQVPSVAPSRSSQPSGPATGSSDSLVASDWAPTGQGTAATRILLLSSLRTHPTDAGLTYLRTGRLRL